MTSVLSFRSERFSALRFLTEGFHQGFRRKFIVFKKKIMRRKLVWCVKESLEISCWTSASWLRQLIFCTYKHAHLSDYFWSMWVLMRDYSVFCYMRQIGHAWRQQRIGKKSSHIKMLELGIKLVTETGTESFCFWGFHKVRGPEAFVSSLRIKESTLSYPFMTDMLKHNGPSVTDTLSSGESRSAHAPPGFSPNGQTNYKMYQKKHIVLL